MAVNFNNTNIEELYKDFNYKAANPIIKENKLLDVNAANLAQLQHDKVESSTSAKQDKYSADDGKISPKDKLINFGKGIISPITNMLKSPKNFITGAAMIAGVSALTVATGGAIAPLLVTLGLVGGGIQFGLSAYKAATAKTDDEAKNAWQGLGAGTTAVVGSVAGAKAAVKAGGIEGAENMNTFQATLACVKNAHKSFSNSLKTFTSGEAFANLGIKKKTVPIKEEQTTPREETKPEVKEETPKANTKEDTVIKEETSKNESVQVKKTEQETPVEVKTEEAKPTVQEESSVKAIENPAVKSSLNGKEIILKSKNGKEIKANITIEKGQFGKETIYIKDENGGILGSSTVEPMSIKDFTMDDGLVITAEGVKEYLGDGNALYVDIMSSRIDGFHVGTALHKANIARSQELGCNGKVFFQSSWKSPTFHYKSGFRTFDPATNEMLSNMVAAGEKIDAGDLGRYYYMFMPTK